MPPVRIDFYSDILCIWAYAAQRRLEHLSRQFGESIQIEAHFCSVFPDARGKIEEKWKHRGGFFGFSEHLNQVAEKFPHIEVNPRLWLEVRPRTSASAHIFLKAMELIERDKVAAGAPSKPYLERLSTRAAWEVRKSFFASARDISDWEVLAEIVESLGIDYAIVEERIISSEAVAQLAIDYDLSTKNDVSVSPTLVMNDGRQKLLGNVGYKLIEANVQELLRHPSKEEASWC